MIHPSTCLAHVNNHIGYGVFATACIPRGTIVYVKDPLEIEVQPGDYGRLDSLVRAQVDRYSYREPGGIRVVSWDLAKYVNHSCEANSLSCGWGLEIAVRDIEAGEQITDDYGLLNIDESMACSCGAANCRRLVDPGDMERESPRWDELVRASLKDLTSVEQPLWELVDESARRGITRYLAGRAAYLSVARLAFRGDAEVLRPANGHASGAMVGNAGRSA